jgi:hypothetical protein
VADRFAEIKAAGSQRQGIVATWKSVPGCPRAFAGWTFFPFAAKMR